ncbi:hypothetical protein DPMN_178552 [Dreissena polymorpha]|uniref:Uncharacterized protein n=1 Tax=Dreissena polymorpha TaxID=45954 RepID=A0A9D4ED18_DREPO|nr:hypothetical protein DPMN_178552 [Dreissena polymorpha]
MTRKRKDRNSSGSASGNVNKATKPRGPSEEIDSNISVSEILSKASAVLFPDSNSADDNTFVLTPGNNSNSNSKQSSCSNMADGGREPTNKDLMDCMNALGVRIGAMERKLGVLDNLEVKVMDFDKELKKIWLALDDRVKRTDARVMSLEERVDYADVGAAQMAEKVAMLEKQREELRDDVAHLKSQSMRNNLVFTIIQEDNSTVNETAETTETKLRNHLQEKLKIAKDIADTIRFERVHRSPGQPVSGKIRNIVAKFTFFKDREMVQREWKHLSGAKFLNSSHRKWLKSAES